MRTDLFRIVILFVGFFPLSVVAEGTPAVAAEQSLGLGNLTQVIFSLLLVLLVFAFMIWVMRHIGHIQTGGMSNLKVLEQVSVGQRERIALIQVGEEQIIIGVAAGNVRMLHAMSKPVSINEPKERERFAERLADALRRKNK